MRRARSWAAAFSAAAIALAGCGGDEPAPARHEKDAGPPAPACAPGELLLDTGDCLQAGMQENGCAAGEALAEGGKCVPAGIPPEACGKGFEPDDSGGCNVILPAKACAGCGESKVACQVKALGIAPPAPATAP